MVVARSVHSQLATVLEGPLGALLGLGWDPGADGRTYRMVTDDLTFQMQPCGHHHLRTARQHLALVPWSDALFAFLARSRRALLDAPLVGAQTTWSGLARGNTLLPQPLVADDLVLGFGKLRTARHASCDQTGMFLHSPGGRYDVDDLVTEAVGFESPECTVVVIYTPRYGS